MKPVISTIILLSFSNIFMSFAWYAHLKQLANKPWWIAVLISWSIALFEYVLLVPANRIGYTVMTISQLKILQELISLSIFVPFSLFYLKEPFKQDYIWAGICLIAAVYFMFRHKITG